MLRLVGDCTSLDAERGVVQASKVNPVQAGLLLSSFWLLHPVNPSFEQGLQPVNPKPQTIKPYLYMNLQTLN